MHAVKRRIILKLSTRIKPRRVEDLGSGQPSALRRTQTLRVDALVKYWEMCRFRISKMQIQQDMVGINHWESCVFIITCSTILSGRQSLRGPNFNWKNNNLIYRNANTDTKIIKTLLNDLSWIFKWIASFGLDENSVGRLFLVKPPHFLNGPAQNSLSQQI